MNHDYDFQDRKNKGVCGTNSILIHIYIYALRKVVEPVPSRWFTTSTREIEYDGNVLLHVCDERSLMCVGLYQPTFGVTLCILGLPTIHTLTKGSESHNLLLLMRLTQLYRNIALTFQA